MKSIKIRRGKPGLCVQDAAVPALWKIFFFLIPTLVREELALCWFLYIFILYDHDHMQ
jgi:hypothetical protein